MDIGCAGPSEDEETDGENDGSYAADLKSGFWRYGFSGWCFGSSFLVIVVLDGSEKSADDEADSDAEKGESSETG